MSPEILAYTAGFLDGEGSINILRYRKNEKWSYHYFFQVAIGQNDAATLDWIADNFGGGVYLVKRDGSFFWTITNQKAFLFLQKLLPYLKYKKPQAELAIAFYKECIEPRRKKTFGEKVTDENKKRREWYYEEAKRLKKVFTTTTYKGITKLQQQRLNEETPKGDAIV